MNFRSLAAFVGLLSASSAIISFFSARHFGCFCKLLIRFLSLFFTSFNLLLEFSSSFLFLDFVNPEYSNEVNDTILDSNWSISLLTRSWDVISYRFESFSCGIKPGGSFDFALAVKICRRSKTFEAVEVFSIGSIVSGVDVDVIAAKKFYKTYYEIFC